MLDQEVTDRFVYAPVLGQRVFWPPLSSARPDCRDHVICQSVVKVRVTSVSSIRQPDLGPKNAEKGT